ncbi:serine protease inhibitor A3N-like [Aplochiton taeniatus]
MMRAALSLWIVSAVLCLGRSDHHHHHRGHDKGHISHGINQSLSLIVDANQEFAFRLYKQITIHPNSQGKNVFFSPISVTVALTALSVGARGQTHQQLFQGLGLNNTLLTRSEVDQSFKALLTMAHYQTQDKAAGTALFIHNTFEPRSEYLGLMKQSYYAEGFNVDFTNTSNTTNTINSYVKEKTKGKIDELVKDLDPATIMYLLNYIYYKGEWDIPFDPLDTREGTFHVDSITTVPVQMMSVEDTFSTYYDQEIATTVLYLRFNDSDSMILALPDNGLAGLEEVLSQNHIAKWNKWKKARELKLFVPKFSIKTSFSLKDVLSQMGMSEMFSKQADFSGISEQQNIFVSEVVHQASLDVDEHGATAAGATGVKFTPLSYRFVPILKFDRPFFVMLTDTVTNSILFMGKIVNPNI